LNKNNSWIETFEASKWDNQNESHTMKKKTGKEKAKGKRREGRRGEEEEVVETCEHINLSRRCLGHGLDNDGTISLRYELTLLLQLSTR
jgi:hypothetical protein